MTDKTFTLSMLPAANGDAIWISVGETGAVKHILIDAGVAGTAEKLAAHVARLQEKFGQPVVISLLVLTHIDEDHIDGVLGFLSTLRDAHAHVEAMWYNGYHQVFNVKPEKTDTLGPANAERVSAMAQHLRIPVNPGLSDDAALTVESCSQLDSPNLPGVAISVLGPTQQRVNQLRRKWRASMKGAQGTIYAQTRQALEDDVLGGTKKIASDASASNGSSIILLIEYEEIGVLMTGDAFGPDLNCILENLRESQRENVRFIKLPHHGSWRNMHDELPSRTAALHYLISTDGRSGHPDTDTISLVNSIKPSAVFHFNYTEPRARVAAAVPGVAVGKAPDTTGLHLNLIDC